MKILKESLIKEYKKQVESVSKKDPVDIFH